MSIRHIIREWERGGDLKLLPPVLPSDPLRRAIFCNQEVWSALHGPWATAAERNNMSLARAELDNFVVGRLISVRLPPSKDVKARLALLEDAHEEVWEARCREPSPQVRIFGRFAERDLFIAFIKRNRDDVDEFFAEKELTKRLWRTLFPSYNPHTGIKADDYVSHCFPV
jgi:hypothetical protein